jgi:hypothetical protein
MSLANEAQAEDMLYSSQGKERKGKNMRPSALFWLYVMCSFSPRTHAGPDT